VAVGSASFGVVDCDGNLYADSHRDAERRVSILNGSDIAGKPYRVVPLYATHASAAGREGAHGPGKCLSVDAIEFDRTVASREQDEREVWIRADERKRCEKAARHAGLVDYGTANQFDALCQQRDKCADAIRALLAAEAEGGWES
jgi:hypothetical protein